MSFKLNMEGFPCDYIFYVKLCGSGIFDHSDCSAPVAAQTNI